MSGFSDFSIRFINGNENRKLLVYSRRLISLIVGLNLAREVLLLIQVLDQLHLNVAEKFKETEDDLKNCFVSAFLLTRKTGLQSHSLT